MTLPIVPYETVEHLHDDIEAAKEAATVVLIRATSRGEVWGSRPGQHPWQAAADALGAVLAWLDVIEASAAAAIDQPPDRKAVTESEAA